MLKNFNTQINLKNFTQSSMYGDYFIKKITLYSMLSILTYVIVFAEKYIIEYIPKNIHNNMLNINNTKINLSYNFLRLYVHILNIIFIILIVC